MEYKTLYSDNIEIYLQLNEKVGSHNSMHIVVATCSGWRNLLTGVKIDLYFFLPAGTGCWHREDQ